MSRGRELGAQQLAKKMISLISRKVVSPFIRPSLQTMLEMDARNIPRMRQMRALEKTVEYIDEHMRCVQSFPDRLSLLGRASCPEDYWHRRSFFIEAASCTMSEVVEQSDRANPNHPLSRRARSMTLAQPYRSKAQIFYESDGVMVIDDLFQDRTVRALYAEAMELRPEDFDDTYAGYQAVNFTFRRNFRATLFDVLHTIKNAFPDLGYVFKRGWFFVYDQAQCGGVKLHADPVELNMNLWVTPTHVLDPDKNGLVIWKNRAPQNWPRHLYNGISDPLKVIRFLAGIETIRIPYRRNRLIIFDSGYFHRTDGVRVRDTRHKRVNYTFLFGSERNL